MKHLAPSIGTIHFIGIGGIGMSGIAEVLHNLDYAVQGSDAAQGANVERLRARGIPVVVGHDAANVGNAAVVVYSSAVKRDNPEMAAARAKRLPLVRRAEMLAELMRLKWSVAVGGTHGKTTTTSMIAAVLESANLDPTVINGGIINAYGTNTRLGQGDWMVVESDESDGTFVRLPATVAVVTNIDPEHMEHWGTFDRLRDAFATFADNVPFYGFSVLCTDHPEVQALVPRLADRRIITYGFNPKADVRAIDEELGTTGAEFSVLVSNRVTGGERQISRLTLPMFGRHNVQNALAAVAVGCEMGLAEDAIRAALAGFAGVKRRMTRTGESGGVVVFDDYGHHPVEIATVLAAARTIAQGRIVAVVQPHRYTRLSNLFEGFSSCFNDADTVIVADVYPAGEAPIEGANRDALVAGLQAHGHRDVRPLAEPGALAAMVAEVAAPGDLVVFLGAGSITNWAQALPGELDALRAGPLRANER